MIRFFAPWKRKDAPSHRKHPLGDVEVARRRREALRRRHEAFGSPPMSELEVAMRYGVVEAERAAAGRG